MTTYPFPVDSSYNYVFLNEEGETFEASWTSEAYTRKKLGIEEEEEEEEIVQVTWEEFKEIVGNTGMWLGEEGIPRRYRLHRIHKNINELLREKQS